MEDPRLAAPKPNPRKKERSPSEKYLQIQYRCFCAVMENQISIYMVKTDGKDAKDR